MDIEELKNKVRVFNADRDWDRYHNPKDLVVALMSEVGELAECYRWLNDTEIASIHANPEKRKHVEEELADIMIYLLTFAHNTGIDLGNAVEQKLEKNGRKYPAETMKGKHSNFLEGIKGSLRSDAIDDA